MNVFCSPISDVAVVDNADNVVAVVTVVISSVTDVINVFAQFVVTSFEVVVIIIVDDIYSPFCILQLLTVLPLLFLWLLL